MCLSKLDGDNFEQAQAGRPAAQVVSHRRTLHRSDIFTERGDYSHGCHQSNWHVLR